MAPDFEFLYDKMQYYCSYQERCLYDVQTKLRSWKVQEQVMDKIIRKLLDEDFINEERFARVFAGGKFRIKKWGKNKIFAELAKRRIPDLYIQMALQEIEDDEYVNALQEVLTQKDNQLRENNLQKRKHKLLQYALSKGYDKVVVFRALEGLI